LLAALMVDGDMLRGGDPAVRWREALAASTHTAGRARGLGLPAGIQGRAAGPGRLERAGGPGRGAGGGGARGYGPLAGRGLVKALETGLLAGAAIDGELRGSIDALARYAAAVTDGCDRHLHERSEQYGRERRWADRPFWRRRHVSFDGARPRILD